LKERSSGWAAKQGRTKGKREKEKEKGKLFQFSKREEILKKVFTNLI